MALLLLLPDALPRPWREHTHTRSVRVCAVAAEELHLQRRKRAERKRDRGRRWWMVFICMWVNVSVGKEEGRGATPLKNPPHTLPFFSSLQHHHLLLHLPLPLSKSIGREGRDRCISPQIELAKTCHIQLGQIDVRVCDVCRGYYSKGQCAETMTSIWSTWPSAPAPASLLIQMQTCKHSQGKERADKRQSQTAGYSMIILEWGINNTSTHPVCCRSERCCRYDSNCSFRRFVHQSSFSDDYWC